MTRRGVYPGSFNPPTIAHREICRAAIDQRQLDSLDLVVSRNPLGKDPPTDPPLEERLRILRSSVSDWPSVSVKETDEQLVADIAEGYDVVIMGADKWRQVRDPAFYDHSVEARDQALARLPELAIAPRAGIEVPPEDLLDLPPWVAMVSSTAARAGITAIMTAPARLHAQETGAWTSGSSVEPNAAPPPA